MSFMIAFRNAGPTVRLAVSNVATASTPINVSSNDQTNFASFQNMSNMTVAIFVSQISATAPAAVFPVAGTPQNCLLLPPSMSMPMAFAVPAQGFNCSAISDSNGTGDVYITPVGNN